jgi:hypothetical protein
MRSTSGRSVKARAWKASGTSSTSTATLGSTPMPKAKVPTPRSETLALAGCSAGRIVSERDLAQILELRDAGGLELGRPDHRNGERNALHVFRALLGGDNDLAGCGGISPDRTSQMPGPAPRSAQWPAAPTLPSRQPAHRGKRNCGNRSSPFSLEVEARVLCP